MRMIEVILCVCSGIVAIYSILNGRQKDNKNYLALIILLPLMVAHVFFEGIRWQLYGVYVYLPYLLYRLLIIKTKRFSIGESGQNKIIASLCLVSIFVSVLLASIFKMNELPELTGKFEVGTVSMDLVDENRLELYGATKGQHRKIRVQFWYPIDNHEGKKIAPWLTDGKVVATAVPREAGLPGFILEQSTLIKSHSYEDANLSESSKTYPVILISHGWTGYRNLHSDFAEMLASHGYIAISIDHTYGSLATVFDNDEIAMLDREALPDRETTDDFLEYANALVTTYAYDSRLVLDYLDNLANNSMFYQRIDYEKIGAVGHSTGGGGIVKLSLEDPRIKAILGLDPWVEPIGHDLLRQGLTIPTLFIRSEMWEIGYNNAYIKSLVEGSKVMPMTYQMNGGNHLDFSMLYMFQPLYKIIGYSGKLDPVINASIQRDFILKFFDATLLGLNNNLSELDKEYEPIVEVSYTK